MNLDVTNPFDGSKIATVPLADKSAIDQAIATSHEAFQATKKLPPYERSKVLYAAAELFKKQQQDFTDTIVAEAGKPIALAEMEAGRAINTVLAGAEEARHGAQGEWVDLDNFPQGAGHVGMAKRFPIGVIYGITPFNFPLNLVLHKVVPAIATGNSIVIKPSPRTPLTALKLENLFLEAGCPKGQVSVVVCPNDLATYAIENPLVKFVSFTGSAAVGWQIKQKAAKQKVKLELGGNAALIVHDDADLTAAVAAAAIGGFAFAGQTCISVQRILVQNKVYETFRDMLLKHIREKLHVGDPRDRNNLIGPMIDKAALQRVQATIDAAVKAGATILCGNETKGPCLTPTLLENADLKSPICQTELFAPVATMHRYEKFEEALNIANDSIYGLQAGVFTRDISRAWQAYETLEVGGVLINQSPMWRSETMPYGGVKQSGLGREGIKYAMAEMTEPRMLVLRVNG